jgi:hypothetical protein
MSGHLIEGVEALEAVTSLAQGLTAIYRLPSRIEDVMDGYRVEEAKKMTSIHYY